MPWLRISRREFAFTLAAATAASWKVSAQDLKVPNAPGSIKFGVIGDSGTADKAQFDVAVQMMRFRNVFSYDRVIMLGDNIYGGQTAQDFDAKFAKPYKALLDAGVKFYAALGNHDDVENRKYPGFNMGGERYYMHTSGPVRFFVLDTDQLDPKQLTWLEDSLKNATEPWKIVYFHHPLYSDGGTHGSDINLRVILEPLFLKYGVKVVFAGHDHFYERITPQKGITHFVCGSAGQLRKGDIKRTAMTASGFDTDYAFMIVEIADNDMSFQAISRKGQIVDSGVVHLNAPAAGTR